MGGGKEPESKSLCVYKTSLQMPSLSRVQRRRKGYRGQHKTLTGRREGRDQNNKRFSKSSWYSRKKEAGAKTGKELKRERKKDSKLACLCLHAFSPPVCASSSLASFPVSKETCPSPGRIPFVRISEERLVFASFFPLSCCCWGCFWFNPISSLLSVFSQSREEETMKSTSCLSSCKIQRRTSLHPLLHLLASSHR